MNPTRPPRVLEAARLDALIGALREQGWNVVGPRLEDGAIIYDEIASAADLPAGWTWILVRVSSVSQLEIPITWDLRMPRMAK